MKKLIVLPLITAVMLLTWGSVAPAHGQDTAKDDKPTFYHLIPGTYVNGWPRFTIHYPKDWVEEPHLPQEAFRARAPGPGHHPDFAVTPDSLPVPLDKVAGFWMSYFKAIDKDVTVVSDKPSQLKDGTPAREVVYQMVENGAPLHIFALGTMKGGVVVATVVGSTTKIGEDLKGILYSLQYEPGKDELVEVPPDIRAFLDKFSSDMVSHDIAKVMTCYSDRYLDSGTKKGEVERFWKQLIGSITSSEVGITDFEGTGDKAYLTGFHSVNGLRHPLGGTSIIRENGEWKWYGNQREIVP